MSGALQSGGRAIVRRRIRRRLRLAGAERHVLTLKLACQRQRVWISSVRMLDERSSTNEGPRLTWTRRADWCPLIPALEKSDVPQLGEGAAYGRLRQSHRVQEVLLVDLIGRQDGKEDS